jgi:DNA topoisomerase-1
MTPPGDLFVIEAPGKAKLLEQILKDLGLTARVKATKGHLYDMPERLTPLGVDSTFRDFKRTLKDPLLGQQIRDEVAAAKRVFIATDADSEGDVIAWDVAELISDIYPEPLRIRLKGMDEESINEAIAAAAPVNKRDAVAGRTRAIIDRMIGATFSHDGVAVGRVGTALLGLVDTKRPSTRKLRLVAPSKSGGRPWVAEGDVILPLNDAIATKLAQLTFPALDFAAETKPVASSPAHMGDIMVRAGDVLDMSPKEADRSLQRLYEAGRMSYPRSGARGMSKGVINKLAKILKQSGYKFDQETVKEKAADDVHDAPYPIGRVEVQRNPVREGQEAGLRTMVGRDIVKSGQKHVIQVASASPIKKFLIDRGFSSVVAEHVASLHWRREEGPRYPGQETWPESSVVTRRADTVVLETAITAGLGRPSTWARHVTSFMSRGLVTDDLALTDKGQEWVAGSPAELLDPRISVAIENACEKGLTGMMDHPDREPWEILSERIVAALPEAIRRPLVQSVASEPAHPKHNPLEPYVQTVGLDEMLAERKRAYTYAPDMPS